MSINLKKRQRYTVGQKRDGRWHSMTACTRNKSIVKEALARLRREGFKDLEICVVAGWQIYPLPGGSL